MNIVRLAALLICCGGILIFAKGETANESEMLMETEKKMATEMEMSVEGEQARDADTDTETDRITAIDASISEDVSDTDSVYFEDDTRIRNLRELDISALNDYCNDDGLCRDLIYDNPQEVVFFEAKPKLRFTSDTTYVFRPLPQFEILQFENSKFANFPVNLFYALKVKELDMRNCSIERVNWDNFLMANELSILLLSSNLLREIKPLTFSSAEQLSFLFLDSNQIDTLHSHSFKDLNKLFMLDLHDNHLTTIPQGMFSYLPALQQLNLAENRLTTLADDTFSNNLRLNSLNVQSNMLQSVAEYVLQNQDDMDYVDFSHNPELTTLVGNVRSKNLWARNCSLTRVNIYGKVNNADFQMNHIMELYFSQPEKLETLRLKENSLQQLASLTEATNLVFFDVSNNPNLKTLPQIWEVDSLEHLDLSNISLRSIPLSVIESPERLINLNVSSNRLTHIHPTHFQHYEKLHQFYMHNNNWNCYNLQLFMDMVVNPFQITYTRDIYDENFPGEYIGGIKCMYRIDDDENADGDADDNDNDNAMRKDQLIISGLAEQFNEAPAISATEEISDVEELRREVKAIVGIYDQRFSIVLNKLDSLDQRLKQFERFNRTMWHSVAITV